MSVVVAAVGGSMLVGAYSADKAADQQADAVNKGLKQSGELAAQSRKDAIDLYNQGRKASRVGLGAAMDFYKKAAPSVYSPVTLGNVAAQKAIGQGAAQANNAILGLPTDMSFAQAQQINPDLSFLSSAQLPAMDEKLAVENAASAVKNQQPASSNDPFKGLLLGGALQNSGSGSLVSKLF